VFQLNTQSGVFIFKAFNQEQKETLLFCLENRLSSTDPILSKSTSLLPLSRPVNTSQPNLAPPFVALEHLINAQPADFEQFMSKVEDMVQEKQDIVDRLVFELHERSLKLGDVYSDLVEAQTLNQVSPVGYQHEYNSISIDARSQIKCVDCHQCRFTSEISRIECVGSKHRSLDLQDQD
jgi:hypothetical protein